ncbi:DUF447 family protein [Azospirillum sp. YIM B02556]|uniref:DUF447 family protein n=1 Tax=Azospirillum endophyticum TaxID=2800326 RepID=A0ABS1FGZ9_9PROT|nr:DUF447 domain-containing protein [Azospirillum endophyticum]MBK1842711.1 DUF447 family protein [Azospirillum endophyticum]
MILETIVTTLGADGTPHIAPFGVTRAGDDLVIAPFRPSVTLDALEATGRAVVNHTDDARLFAGCLTGRRDWPLVPATVIAGVRLADSLAHWELEVVRIETDPVRPRFHCQTVHEETHRPFAGHNRAAAAVIEAAILCSRLHLLPRDKVEREMAYLAIAVEKTAGTREREAWSWLSERVAAFQAEMLTTEPPAVGAEAPDMAKPRVLT